MADRLTVCLFCGSSERVSAAQRDSARAFGAAVAARGLGLVYGGGRIGLMGLAADAALAGGAEVIGVIPRFLADWEVAHTGLTRLDVVETMHARKQRMGELAHAFVILGGGFGTLDEFFEILTWKQLGLHDKPIVVVNADGAWDGLAALLDSLVASGFAREEHRALVRFVASIDEVWPAIEGAPRVRGSIASKLG